ncbi:arylamine N-acetyltransferase family protein [Kribbella solani]|uniref:N-hydroxyarylamine O-acetyltransferase n=1 Tax=Kribbella solani TaxID=236067 RepID=A0A841DT24_9ACTN|nr:arylamine N-acetyltransferase [Kribbella solani]MBB5981149.1 N-hydroxyarylamine O-acetyltransferase [Kribbella solani]
MWNLENLDLDAYLDRIGAARVAPSAAALRDLHRAHVLAIPFENLDVVLGTHPGIGLDAIQHKLVGRQRGGYCYEHALLFGAALEQLGFDVVRRVARVQPHKSGPRTHALLKVGVDGQEFLADVGFGAGQLYPTPLKDGIVVDQAGWDHQLTQDGELWTLSKRTADGWEPQHASNDEPVRPIDYEVYHHYVSTHPNSPFTGRPVVMRVADGVVRRLVGDTLTIEHADGETTTRTIPPVDLPETLAALDVVLNDEEIDRLRLL